jgi:hypothetical protein
MGTKGIIVSVGMNKRDLAAKLDAHQTAILPIVSWGIRQINREASTASLTSELIAKRMELTRLLVDYALFKHRDVFAPAIAMGGDKAVEGMRLKAACIEMGERYRAFIRSPDSGQRIDDWSSYRYEALAMAIELHEHLVSERVAIRKLLGLRSKDLPVEELAAEEPIINEPQHQAEPEEEEQIDYI